LNSWFASKVKPPISGRPLASEVVGSVVIE
jgi:hypothetical protein